MGRIQRIAGPREAYADSGGAQIVHKLGNDMDTTPKVTFPNKAKGLSTITPVDSESQPPARECPFE